MLGFLLSLSFTYLYLHLGSEYVQDEVVCGKECDDTRTL